MQRKADTPARAELAGPSFERAEQTPPLQRPSSARAEQAPPLEDYSRRVVVEHIRPTVDGGRFPIKRTVGEAVEVTADIFADGHDVIAAVLRDRIATTHNAETAENAENAEKDRGAWRETPMTPTAPGIDQWTGRFEVAAPGWHEYAIVAWVDRFRSWRRDLQIKAEAGQDVSLELLEGSLLVREASARAEQIGAGVDDANRLLVQADALSEATELETRVRMALDEELEALMDTYADRSRSTATPSYRVWVDRERARFGAWYEMFPRSSGTDPNRSGTFRDAAARLPYIADLGFDVVYLAPIHPIGRSFRKGRNNGLTAGPRDPGSPWAIGSDEGGHTAIEPGLGTFTDFELFRDEAARLGLEVALDLAWQCSPDHPWVREHPEWFRHRPDGTIKYAENPPKKYQDIYPLDFECEDWPALWRELLRVTLFWVEHGVRIFRVDNPHTKAFGFWEWLIHEVHARSPEAIFLAEAFTRPKPMRYLAKCGFTQSYTYFTWRNTKDEIVEYFSELTGTEVAEYLRPNLFANTPDILHEYLQHGGRAAFEARLLLAATLGASYGIYNGFELAEHRAIAGTEEYADSEKYQIRLWDWDRPGHIKELVARVNQIRQQHRALQFDRTLRFHRTDNPQIVAYSKTSPDGESRLFVVVNLDPRHMQHGWVEAPAEWIRAIAAPPDRLYTARDLIDDVEYAWRGEWNYVRLDPGVRQGHIFSLEPRRIGRGSDGA
jgi:starch synthase (maltosyl-transferring)